MWNARCCISKRIVVFCMGIKLSYVSDIPEPDGYIPPKIALPMRLRILVCSIYWKGHWFNFHFRINTTIPLCSTIEVPTNTRLTSDASMLDMKLSCFHPHLILYSDNILSCNEPNDKSMFGGVISEVKTRTLPPGIRGHQLSFHYICGKFMFRSKFVNCVDIKISRIK